MLGPNALIILLLAGWGIIVAIVLAAGIVRPRSIGDFDRPPPGQAGLLVGLLVAGFMAWLIAQGAYGAVIQARVAAAHGTPAKVTEADFTTLDWAILSTVPPLTAFALLLIAHYFTSEMRVLKSLGFTAHNAQRGVLYGLIGAVAIVPGVYLLSAMVEAAYEQVKFRHPAEHELLLAMKHASGFSQVLLIIGAAVLAPLFEELLFRGHLQTLIRRSLILLSHRPGRGFPVVVPPEATQLPYAAPEVVMPTALTPTVATPARWQTWLAIVLASLVFAGVHPLWMAPPIFALSLGLGFTYERTGNLWASITIHCVFNSVSTAIYLYGVN